MNRWKVSLLALPQNPLFQGLLVLLFLVPLAATAGQFYETGFFTQIIHVQVLFWPGAEWTWAPAFYVWFVMGIMGLSYLIGIGSLAYRKTFGRVVLVSLAALIVSQSAATIVNNIAGWKELQNISSMHIEGKANRVILTLWHNPAWEEIVFRGIPLLLLTITRKNFPKAGPAAMWAYFLIPSAAMALYHVPNHGLSRLTDTFILSIAFAWMALRYGFFAPLVIHYIFDAMMVTSLTKIPNFPINEIPWLVANNVILNSAWSIVLLSILVSMPGILLWNRFIGNRKSETKEFEIATIDS